MTPGAIRCRPGRFWADEAGRAFGRCRANLCNAAFSSRLFRRASAQGDMNARPLPYLSSVRWFLQQQVGSGNKQWHNDVIGEED